MATAKTLKVVGQNPNSGGGYVVVVAEDEHGQILLDLASGQMENVAKGEKSVVLLVDDNEGSNEGDVAAG